MPDSDPKSAPGGPAQPGPTQSGATQPGTAKAGPLQAGPFLTGQLLVAMPSIGDQRFAQSVIYLCAHSADAALGIIVNRPLARPSFDDLLRQLNIAPLPPARRINVCTGGPVDDTRGFVLHTSDWISTQSMQVANGLALTASLDVLKVIAEGGGPRAGVLALGHASWGPGQLDHEVQQSAWLTAPADDNIVFDTRNDTKWRRALAKLKIDPLLLSSEVGHA